MSDDASRPHFVYIVRCADGTLYTGYAVDTAKRLEAHNAGRGARYTSGRGPVRLVYCESCATRGEALRREHAIKRLTRAQKEALVGPPPRRRARAAAPAATSTSAAGRSGPSTRARRDR